MWTFTRDRLGRYACRLGEAERAVLVDVVDGVVELLGGPTTDPAVGPERHPLDALRLSEGPVSTPDDPAVRRLLPDASVDDPQVTAEFRRLTDADLRATKVAHLRGLRTALVAGGSRVVVNREDADRVAAALTDLRLVVSERLGVRTDEDAERVYRTALGETPGTEDRPDGRDPDGATARRRFLATVYVALSTLQESLVELMLTDLGEPRG